MKTNFEKLGFLAAAICGLAVFLMVGAAEAQDNPPFECDNNFGECGTPEQSGGGCGCGGGSILITTPTSAIRISSPMTTMMMARKIPWTTVRL